ncbi:F-box/LRR-repeat protein [Striga asiatica]|uniref:F-box/LRR-repeat protein n=1 Tax=Striga asiatica TaxID=4170 RepID=A0A5A7PHE9_STRAF|nr:F-box/LRR-repeat protein [Striga asiatica]
MENDDMELGLSENVENVIGVGGELALQASDGTGNITTLDFDIENGKNSDEGFALGGEGEVKGDFLKWVNKVEARWAAVGGSKCQERKPDVDLNLGLGFEPSSSSSSSLALPTALAMERDTFEYEQNKRPKIQSFPLYWGSNFENRIHCTGSVNEKIGVTDVPDLRVSESDGGNNSDPLKLGDCSEMRMDLTDDLLHMVFSFLDNIDLCSVASVCRQWRDASSHEDFWRYLNFENRPISEHQFWNMCRRYPNANAVNLYGTPAINQLGMKAIRSLRNLEVLTLGNSQLGEKFFKVLTDCRKLRSLTINDATLCNGTLDVSVDHDSLRDLQIVKCRIFRVTIRCPQLEILSLKRSSMPHAILSCPLLRELDIASCHKLLDTSIRAAAASCPLLESLDMSNCSSIIDETIREIAMSTGNLRFLDASYCPNVALESVILPMLKVLKLHSCEGITSASMAAIRHSSMLEVLELDNCSLLASVSLDLQRLQKIRLVHCRKLIDLNLRSSVLSSITVSNCPSLQRIDIASAVLSKLVLQKQESLTMLSLESPCLEELDLSECESLKSSICEIFNTGGGCPALRSLILDNCESLTEMSFCSTSLVSVSLGGCRAMTSLDLNCPHLKNISLDGCDHLERAKFSPVGLKSLNLGICPKLTVLHLKSTEMVSLELKGCGVLSEAFIGCPLLTSLDASFCSQLKDDCLSATTLSCPIIESLVLMQCHSVGPDGLSSLSSLQSLTYLDLSYTFLVHLQPVYDSCLYLKVLKLQACKYLSDTSLKPLYKGNALPSLSELDLSYDSLCQTAIEELVACCARLSRISLNGCINMHDLDWTTISGANRLLQNLNCVGCSNIKKVIVPPYSGCIHLSSLNLSLSYNLREVDLSCPNLLLLNLSNCYSLKILKLHCPRLSSLFLQSCSISEDAMEAATRDCNMLETLDIRFCPKVISTSSMVKLRASCPSLKRIFNSLVPP